MLLPARILFRSETDALFKEDFSMVRVSSASRAQRRWACVLASWPCSSGWRLGRRPDRRDHQPHLGHGGGRRRFPASGRDRDGDQHRDRPAGRQRHGRARLLPPAQPADRHLQHRGFPGRLRHRDGGERPPAARLDPDHQLQPAELGGVGDHHRHGRGAGRRGDQHGGRHDDPAGADRSAADLRPRLQGPGAADPARPASTPSAATCRSRASAASTPT